MAECNSIKYNFIEQSFTKYSSPNIYRSLHDKQFRLNKISKVRDYFIGEIKGRS